MNRSLFVSHDGDELAERDEAPGAAVDGGLEEAVEARALGAVEAEDDRDRVARVLVAQEARLGAVQGDAEGPRDDLGRDAGAGRLLAVDDELDLRRLVLDEPVDVDDAGRLLEDLLHLAARGRSASPCRGRRSRRPSWRGRAGPGGTSVTFRFAPWRLAIGRRSVRTSLANVWLSRLRWSFGRRLTCRSATRGPDRRK